MEYAGYPVYYNPVTTKYVTVDPDTNEVVKENDNLEVEIGESLETGEGHEHPT